MKAPGLMKARPLAASPVLALLVSAALAAPDRGARQASSAAPPPTRTDNVREVLHGVEMVDPYRWLEDQNSPETRAWIDAQNRYTRSVLDSIPGRERLSKRIAKLLKVDSVSEPVERKGKYFFTKRLAEQDLPVIVMRNGLRGKDEVLIDPHPMSADHTVSVDIQEVSHDGSLLAYGVRKGGEDQAEVRLMEVASRKTLPDRLPRALYLSVAVKHDNSGLFYSRHGDEGSRVFYHALGADPSGDVELFGKGYGPDKGIDAEISSDGRTLLITVEYGSSADQTEVYVQDLVDHGPIRPVVNDVPARFTGTAAGGRLFLQTNWKAPKNRILAVDLRDAGGAGPERWREVVPESDAVIESFTPAAGKLFVNYTRNASSVLKVYEPDGEKGREGWREGGDIELPAVGSVSGLRGRWESDEVFFSFTSFHIPSTVFRYDAKKRRQEVWARMKVPIRSGRFETQQVWYLSKDGTKIPMFIVSPRKIKRDGSNPTLLTGYGGFNLSEKPVFSARTALWIERGGILALPSLRGGGEFGEDWHRGGMGTRNRRSWPSPEGATAAFSSAQPSRSGPNCSKRSCAPTRCSTCCATTSSSWRPSGCRSTVRRKTLNSSSTFGRTRRTRTSSPGPAIRPSSSSPVIRTRGSPRCMRGRWRRCCRPRRPRSDRCSCATTPARDTPASSRSSRGSRS